MVQCTSGYTHKKLKARTQIGICLSMFIAVLFTIVKGWKQTKGPLMHEWGKNVIYTYNGI